MVNKKSIYSCIVLLAVFIPQVGQADAGWTGYGYISDLTVDERGRIVVRIDVTENRTECKYKKTFYHEQHGKGSGYIMRVLLTALTREKKVRVYQTSVCDLNNYTYISAVNIIP